MPVGVRTCAPHGNSCSSRYTGHRATSLCPCDSSRVCFVSGLEQIFIPTPQYSFHERLEERLGVCSPLVCLPGCFLVTWHALPLIPCSFDTLGTSMTRLATLRLLLLLLAARAAFQGGNSQGDSSVVIFEAPTAEAVERGKRKYSHTMNLLPATTRQCMMLLVSLV
jgi:hypothetical protein